MQTKASPKAQAASAACVLAGVGIGDLCDIEMARFGLRAIRTGEASHLELVVGLLEFVNASRAAVVPAQEARPAASRWRLDERVGAFVKNASTSKGRRGSVFQRARKIGLRDGEGTAPVDEGRLAEELFGGLDDENCKRRNLLGHCRYVPPCAAHARYRQEPRRYLGEREQRRAAREGRLRLPLAALEKVDVAVEAKVRMSVIAGMLAGMDITLREAFSLALSRLDDASPGSVEEFQAWKLLLLTHRLLLPRRGGADKVPKGELLERAARFQGGDFLALLEESWRCTWKASSKANGDSLALKLQRSMALDYKCEVSLPRARCALVASALAAGLGATPQELRDPLRRLRVARELLSSGGVAREGS